MLFNQILILFSFICQVTTNNTSVVIQNLTIYTAYKFDVVAHYINLLYPHELVGIPSDKVSVVEWTSQDGKLLLLCIQLITISMANVFFKMMNYYPIVPNFRLAGLQFAAPYILILFYSRVFEEV